jgi:PAS domain-containing protein
MAQPDMPAAGLLYVLAPTGRVLRCDGLTSHAMVTRLPTGALFWDGVHASDVSAVVGWLTQLQAAPRDPVHAVYRRPKPHGPWTWCQTVLFAQLVGASTPDPDTTAPVSSSSSSSTAAAAAIAVTAAGPAAPAAAAAATTATTASTIAPAAPPPSLALGAGESVQLPVRDAAEAIQAIVAYETVLPELDRVERITNERVRLRELLECQADGIFQLDGNGLFLYINAPAAARWGYKADDLIGRPCWAMVVPEDRSAVEERVRVHGQARRCTGTDGSHGSLRGSVETVCVVHAAPAGAAAVRRATPAPGWNGIGRGDTAHATRQR